MKFFGKSVKELELASDELQRAMDSKAMELAGDRSTNIDAVLALAKMHIEVQDALFRKMSTRKLRIMQVEMQSSADNLKRLSQAPGVGKYESQILRADYMRLESKMRQIDSHIQHSPKSTSIKQVALVFGFAAAALFITELLKRWL
jgi:hypothetical protein